MKNTDTRVITMLIGNKTDILEREVPYNTAMNFAMEHGFGFMEVSAKDNVGIQEAFNRLILGKCQSFLFRLIFSLIIL